MSGPVVFDAKARVTLTLEVDVSSHWGQDCTVGQVHEQASEMAENAIREAIRGERRLSARIIGKPSVEMVTSGVLK